MKKDNDKIAEEMTDDIVKATEQMDNMLLQVQSHFQSKPRKDWEMVALYVCLIKAGNGIKQVVREDITEKCNKRYSEFLEECVDGVISGSTIVSARGKEDD